jgi:hypothetical protein
VKANGRGLKCCVGQVYHFRVGCFSVMKEMSDTHSYPCLKLKIQPCQLKFVYGVYKTTELTTAAHHATVVNYDRKLFVTLAGTTAVSLMALGIMNYIKTLGRIFLCFAVF